MVSLKQNEGGQHRNTRNNFKSANKMEFGVSIARNHATLKRCVGNFTKSHRVLVGLVVQRKVNDGVRFI